MKSKRHRSRTTIADCLDFRRFFLVASAVVLISGSSTGVVAQDGENPLDRADIEASYSEIDEMIADMQGALASAVSALDEVKILNVEDSNQLVNVFFEEMKPKVNLMLERLGPNSVLMDNLEGAKANVIVFKRWFERQPAEFPNRDSQIMRLDQTLNDYDKLADQIMDGRQDAQEALTMLARAQFYRTVERKVETVERSVEMTKRVLASLQGLGAGIRKIAEQDLPTTIPE